MTRGRHRTAVQEILLAAGALSGPSHAEFSEWDLTVAAWRRNKNKFGARGYEEDYPDHKRVMMEIMARSKRDNPIRQGWIEKTRANHYRITSLGEAQCRSLESGGGAEAGTTRAAAPVYEAVIPYVEHRAFRDYCRDVNEPRTWLGAAAFLGITQNTSIHLNDRLRSAENAVGQALTWFDLHDDAHLTRGPSGGGIQVHRQDIERLKEFLGVLRERFRLQLAAIDRRRT
jgi:hypothetical protein